MSRDRHQCKIWVLLKLSESVVFLAFQSPSSSASVLTTLSTTHSIPFETYNTKMKLSLAVGCALLLSQTTAFNVAPARQMSLTQHHMFGGAGAGKAKEDNPEESAQMEQAAKSMGMSVDEYAIAMNARTKLAETLDSTMVTAGKAETVFIERDVNNPPKTFEVTITEAGKALGKDVVSKELVTALKKASEEARGGRAEAQKVMMSFITEQLK
jgi:hypothetical protein